MLYFDDAENDPDQFRINHLKWEEVKKKLVRWYKRYNTFSFYYINPKLFTLIIYIINFTSSKLFSMFTKKHNE